MTTDICVCINTDRKRHSTLQWVSLILQPLKFATSFHHVLSVICHFYGCTSPANFTFYFCKTANVTVWCWPYVQRLNHDWAVKQKHMFGVISNCLREIFNFSALMSSYCWTVKYLASITDLFMFISISIGPKNWLSYAFYGFSKSLRFEKSYLPPS